MGKLIKCKTCGAEIAKSAKVCPHCGAKNKCSHPILAVVLIIFGILLLANGIGNATKPSSNSEKTNDVFYQESGGIFKNAVSPSIKTGKYGNVTIDGTLSNVSGKKLSYAQIEFSLFDSSRAQIGIALANINSIAEGTDWKYSASPLTLEDFATFDLADISSW